MDKVLLKILITIFNPLFGRQGIDMDQLKHIVQLKLLMDRRRINFSWRRQQQKEEESNQLLRVLLVYGIFGLFIGIFVALVPSFQVGMILFHTYLVFMMAMTLITDFSTVLLDTADNQIILPRPVDSKTLFAARMTHILIYLFQFTLALSLVTWAVIFYRYGWLVGLAGILTSLLTVLLAVFITYCLYLLLMRITSEQKVKEVITYFQIFMTIFFAVSYQLVPRLINMGDMMEQISLQWYSYLLPPVWMSLALEGIHLLHFDLLHLLMSVISIIAPVFLFWILVKYLAPSFAKKIAAAGSDVAAKPRQTQENKVIRDGGLSVSLSGWFCRKGVEASAFRLTWKISGRDKFFRLQFYPNLGYIIVFLFIFVFNSGREMTQHWESLPESRHFLWLIYLPMFSVSGSIMLIAFNENYNASWVYYSAPIDEPGMVVSGTVKALFLKYFVPIYLLMFLFSFYIWGFTIADDFMFGFFNNFLMFLLFAWFSPHYLPFSRQPNTRQQAGRFALMLLQLLFISLLVGLHFLAIRYSSWLLYIFTVLTIPLIWVMIRQLQRLSWNKIAI